MQDLVTVIMTWIAIQFGLPETDHHPKIAFVPPSEIAAIRSRVLLRTGGAAIRMPAGEGTAPHRPEVYAFFDDASGTIYLSDGWSANSPADVSMLVQESVHHLQNLADAKYACPAARERVAYEAQERWLALFNVDLYEAFEINRMARLFLTRCVP